MTIKEAIRRSIDKLLIREYHHSNDDGNIQKLCINTAKYMIDNYEAIIHNGWCYGIENETIDVGIWKESPNTACYDPTTGAVKVGKKLLMQCAEENDVRRLASLIYHEIGHKTNHTKSNSAREIFKDVYVPMFMKFDQDVYEAYSKVLYRFNTREMKARCFEATMFLKQSDTLPSLEEYYGDRCTDLTMMRQFIEMLTSMTRNQNPSNEDKYVIDELYKGTFNKAFRSGNVPHNVKGEKLIKYFMMKYKWFKTRIDKIYYDFKEKFDNNNAKDD